MLLSFGEAVKVLTKRGMGVDGRSCRSEYWWGVLAIFLIELVVSFPIAFILGVIHDYDPEKMVNSANIIGIIFQIVLMMMTMRRLHDVGMSGAWALLMIIPLVGCIFNLIVCTRPGQVGANKYGADPFSPGFYTPYLGDELSQNSNYQQQQQNQFKQQNSFDSSFFNDNDFANSQNQKSNDNDRNNNQNGGGGHMHF